MTGKKDSGEDKGFAGRDGASERLPRHARNALAEAASRRAAQKAAAKPAAGSHKEIGGRDGSDPIRYGDWEVKGRASDF